MSRDDVRHVRDRILAIFLRPDQSMVVASPLGMFGVTKIEISGGVVPLFEWEGYAVRSGEGGDVWVGGPREYKAWLKLVDKDALPRWDFQIGDGEVISLPFNAKPVSIVASLIKHYSRHFPFYPSENYFLNNGKFVA